MDVALARTAGSLLEASEDEESIEQKTPEASPRPVAQRPPIPPGAVDWSAQPSYDLWYQLPDALEHIPALAAKWGLSIEEQGLLRHWVTDGYFSVHDYFLESDIDEVSEQIDTYWVEQTPRPGMDFADVDVGGQYIPTLTHEQLLSVPLGPRLEAKARSNWRIGSLHRFNAAAHRLFVNPRAARICSALFDREAVAEFSLTFTKGSRQTLHQDSCVFHNWPANAIVGMWLALEDIKPGSGPLVYYPESHREPMFAEFAENYPQTQRRTAPADQAERYQAYVDETALRYERREFMARKGEALFWHGMLIHGGSQLVMPGTSRKSFVVHFMPHGANVQDRIVGPFNW